VQIEWKNNSTESPYLFRQYGQWSGLKIHRARVQPGKMLEHACECHEIHINLGGRLVTKKITAAGKLVAVSEPPGNLCLTPSGQTVSASWEKPIDSMGMHLDPGFVAQTAVENSLSRGFEFEEVYKKQDPLIKHIGLALLAEASGKGGGGRLYADSLIQTLVLHLLTNYTNANSPQEHLNGGLSGYKLRLVKEYIDANLEKDLGLSEISAIADLSQFHFARAFRKTTGSTPQQFVMQQRIERAKELLAKNDLPIVEISLRTGFKNQSHFTTLFRKFTKLTPKTWRDLKLA